jgi:SAM-dependent methyltransferase
MSGRRSKPVAQHAYDVLAEAYAERVDTKPHNAYYERPAMLSLLPDVRGKRVLDAGCGPGVYAEWLGEHGAMVIACDANPKMVRLARQRLRDKARVFQANLEEPLDFAQDTSFDIIVAPLVMDYIQDWEVTFREFHRILAPGGILVFSMEHPFTKYLDHQHTSNYFDTDLVEYTWRGFGMSINVPSYRRPLSAVINALVKTGFTVDYLLEPRPTEEFKAADPEEYEALMHSPGFMCVRAYKSV